MRPTFLGFEAAKSGLVASQKNLDIVGHNMTNMSTPGYTRQRVDQVSVSASSYRARYSGNRAALTGQGVNVNGVSQTRDTFLDKRFREEFGDVGCLGQMTEIYSDIESVLDEFSAGKNGLMSAMTGITKALQDYGSFPYSETHANIVATSFKNIAQILHQFDTNLDNVATQQKSGLGISVDEVNTMIEKIANLNRSISEDQRINVSSEFFTPNELYDERNLMLDELSRFCDLDVAPQPDGTVTLKVNGHTALQGDKSERINLQTNNNGTVALTWSTTGENLNLTTGSFKAVVDLLNGRGPNATSASEGVDKGILYFKDKINAFAKTLAQTANSTIPELDADGNQQMDNGVPVFKQLMGALVGTTVIPGGVVNAGNISLSDAWAKDPNYICFKEGSKLNDQLKDIYTKFAGKGSVTFYSHGEEFVGTFEEYVKDYNATLFSEKAFFASRLEATQSVADELISRRDSISGVMRDEETTNMMMFQKSFQASARMMTALDEALDVIINKMGLVGR